MKKFFKRALAASVMTTFLLAGGGTVQALPDNTKGSTPVTFNQQHSNLKISANLYLPKGYKAGKKYPAIVTVHPGGGVKEQTSGLYAMKLAQKGYITLAFDATHQGASEGLPRYIEIPTERIEDIKSAVDYLTTLPQVDTEKIGIVGICAGGGYSIGAAQIEHRIKAVATVRGIDVGNISRMGWDGKSNNSAAQIDALKAMEAQRIKEANGEEILFVHIVSEQDELTPETDNDMVEASNYYRTPRGQHKNSPNLSMFSGGESIMTFHAFADMGTLLTQPILLIAGTRANSMWQSEMAYNNATAAKSRELYKVNGATHMDFYDVEKYVDQAVDKMDKFFKQNL